MDKKGSFILYTRYAEFSKDLSNEEFGKLMRAVFNYEEFNKTPENLSPMAMVLFRVIKNDLDLNAQKYKETCEKRSEAGKKGGRPKKEEEIEEETEKQTKAKKAKGFFEKQTKAKKADNDNEYDNEYDNEVVVVDENEYEGIEPPPLEPSLKTYETLIGFLSPRVVAVLSSYDLPDPLKVKAIQEAHDNNKKNLKYIEAILQRYEKENIRTVTDAEKRETKQGNKDSPQKSSNPKDDEFSEIERLALERRMRKAGDKDAQ